MSLPILTLIYDRKHVASAKKQGTVELRITIYRTVKYYSTGVRLYPKEWSKGTVVRRPDCLEIQDSLDKYVRRARTLLNNMEVPDLDELRKLLAEGDRKINFLEYIEKRMPIKKYGNCEDTMQRYDRFFRFLTDYGKITLFSDITDTKILEMDKYLSDKGMKPYSKWNNYHRFLNSFIIDAINEGLLKRNPYKWVRIDKEKNSGIKKFLTPIELQRIKNVKLPSDCLRKVRDMFIFQTYTCLSYVDLCSFDMGNVENISGSLVYTGKRGKTGQEYSFVLLKPAKEVLDKYNGKLPIISNDKYNDYLKLVATAAGIEKPITSHWARHTGATILLNSGINMEVVAKVLGHSSTRQTRETYAALLKDTLISEMGKVKV